MIKAILMIIGSSLFFLVFLPFMMCELMEPGYIEKLFKKKPKYNYQTQLNFLNESLWVKQVIDSCKTLRQVFNADKLIRCYREKYKGKVEKNLYQKVLSDLNHYFIAKEDKLWNESIRQNSTNKFYEIRN